MRLKGIFCRQQQQQQQPQQPTTNNQQHKYICNLICICETLTLVQLHICIFKLASQSEIQNQSNTGTVKSLIMHAAAALVLM
jgi:DTW domain-containing protein YfiP